MALAQTGIEEKLVTGEELYQMPDLGRCELVEGKLIMMSPTGDRHGAIELNLAAALKAFADSQGRGKVRSGEVGIYVHRNPDTVRAADVLYISNERYAKRGSTGFLDVAPELVVEVLSPEDRWSEVMRKLGEYFEAGVLRVWVVDGSLRSVFAYRSLTEMTRFSEDTELTDEEILPGFSTPVTEVFRE
jgi:Uma2 family endonuclease